MVRIFILFLFGCQNQSQPKVAFHVRTVGWRLLLGKEPYLLCAKLFSPISNIAGWPIIWSITLLQLLFKFFVDLIYLLKPWGFLGSKFLQGFCEHTGSKGRASGGTGCCAFETGPGMVKATLLRDYLTSPNCSWQKIIWSAVLEITHIWSNRFNVYASSTFRLFFFFNLSKMQPALLWIMTLCGDAQWKNKMHQAQAAAREIPIKY